MSSGSASSKCTTNSLSGRCVIYVRVSTKYQALEGMSIENQTKTCREYAKSKGLDIIGVFVDRAKSGRRITGRDQFTFALDTLEKGDVFLVYSVSRASRSVKDMQYIYGLIDEKGCKILSATENLEGDEATMFFNRTLFSMLAEYEALVTRNRVKDVMNFRKQVTGTANNRIRFGWKYDNDHHDESGKLIPIPIKEEQKVIKRILLEREKPYIRPGVKTGKPRPTPFRVIADMLNADNVPTRTRKSDGSYCKWHPQSIKNVIDGEANMSTEMKEILYLFNLEHDDDSEPEQEDDGYIFLSFKGIRRIGLSKDIPEVYRTTSLLCGKRGQVYLYSCYPAKQKHQLLCNWLVGQGYMDVIEEDGIMNDDADIDDIIRYTTQTIGKNPNIVNVVDIPALTKK